MAPGVAEIPRSTSPSDRGWRGSDDILSVPGAHVAVGVAPAVPTISRRLLDPPHYTPSGGTKNTRSNQTRRFAGSATFRIRKDDGLVIRSNTRDHRRSTQASSTGIWSAACAYIYARLTLVVMVVVLVEMRGCFGIKIPAAPYSDEGVCCRCQDPWNSKRFVFFGIGREVVCVIIGEHTQNHGVQGLTDPWSSSLQYLLFRPTR